jgi:anti-anti-sigma factor
MDITRTLTENAIDVAVAGRLDGYWADHLSAALTDVVREGHHHIRLNCSKVTFLSSAGISVLMQFHKNLTTIGGTFSVVSPAAGVVAVLRMTRLADILIETTTPNDAPVESGRAVRHRSRDGMALEVFELDAAARLTCRAIGNPDQLAAGAFADGQSTSLESLRPAVAVGVGAFGESFEDCRPRFGELLSIDGTTVYQPADGTNVADYLLADGPLAAEVRVLYCLSCEGRFSHLIRFETEQPDAVIGLSAIVSACLDEIEAGSLGIVMVAEASGLVGSALRRSPATPWDGPDFFAFPGVRSRLAFTAEGAFPRSVALVGGMVARTGSDGNGPHLRPVGAGTVGHLHAAAFRFQPVRKGQVELGTTVTELFDAERLLGVLHLLNDDRGAAGAGQSEFIRGACWIGRVD